MRVAIVGAGAVGRSIAGELLANGHTVMLIEKDGRKVRTRAVPGAEWVQADPRLDFAYGLDLLIESLQRKLAQGQVPL